MLSSWSIVMDLHSLFADGNVRGPTIHPATRIEVADAFLLKHKSGMCVAAEDPVDVARPRIGQGTLRNLFGKTEPFGAEPVKVSRDDFVSAVNFLKLIKEELSDTADQKVPAEEAVKLMPVDCQMPLAVELPHIPLVNGDTHQMGHHIGEPPIVVSLDPYHLGAAFWI
jgi:hypothetical protein